MNTMIAGFASSLLLMISYYVLRRLWKNHRYVKPRQRGIDPVGEAEVFMAYGRIDDAIRVLRDTIKDEPSNLDAKVSLLRAYSQKQDSGAYGRLAAEIQPELAQQSVWQTIRRTGKEIDPGNPLFDR